MLFRKLSAAYQRVNLAGRARWINFAQENFQGRRHPPERQVLRDLADSPDEAVSAEWDRSEGQPWISTLPTLQLLHDFGIDPGADRVVRAVAGVREHCRWEHAGQLFFSGEVEPCINGRTVTLGVYFGLDMGRLVERLLGEQLADGGWNCEAENGSVRSSFATTINVLEGLLAHERATGGTADSVAARRRGEEYLLGRGLFRRKSTGGVVDASWLQFSFPVWWHYDVLRALEYFRLARARDTRMEETIELVRAKRQGDGRWLLHNTHAGRVWFDMEDGDGKASRWNTLRALRVLGWWDYPLEGFDFKPLRALIATHKQGRSVAPRGRVD